MSSSPNDTFSLGSSPKPSIKRRTTRRRGRVQAVTSRRVVGDRKNGLFATGENGEGQFGIPIQPAEHFLRINQPVLSSLPSSRPSTMQVAQVACSSMASFVLDGDGKIFGAGLNSQGTLGRSTRGDCADRFGLIHPGAFRQSKVVDMSCGSEQALFLTENGRVFRSGDYRSKAGSYLLSSNQKNPSPVEVRLDSLTDDDVTAIAAGSCFSAVATSKSVYLAEGFSLFDESTPIRQPQEIPFETPLDHDSKIVSLEAGGNQLVALVKDQSGDTSVYAYGRNDFGQLGQGHTEHCHVFTKISALDESKIQAIAVGNTHTLILTDDGKALCCGSNKYGQLGDEDDEKATLIPTPIDLSAVPGSPQDLSIASIHCGPQSSALRTSVNQLIVAGCNTSGQFFKEGPETITPPKILPNIECVLFAAGAQHCLIWGKRKPMASLPQAGHKRSIASGRAFDDDSSQRGSDEENERPTKKRKTSSSTTTDEEPSSQFSIWSQDFLSSQKANKWQCKNCFLRNDNSKNQCTCGSVRHAES